MTVEIKASVDRNHKTIYLNKFNPAKHNLYANYWLSRNTSVIKVDGKVKNVTMAACFLRTREFGDCGEFRGITAFVSLDQCNNDLSQHLSRCHLSQKRIREAGLILARSGLFYTIEAQSGEMFVCPKHRAYLGQYWGNQTKSRSCKYPEHKGERKAAKTDRAFTLRVSREVMEMFGVLVTVGASEYLPLNFSATFYLKELRLMNNLFNERVFSSRGVIFFSIV